MEKSTLVPDSCVDSLAPGSSGFARTVAHAISAALDLSAYTLRRYACESTILSCGQLTKAIPLIEVGILCAVLRPASGGTQIVPVTFSGGEFAGLSHLFSEAKVSFDLVTAGPAAVRWVPLADIEAVAQQSPRIMELIVRFLAMRLREVQMRERGWLERGVPDRVRAMLLRVGGEQSTGQPVPRRLVATHEQLAMRCGISRPKLSIELKSLEALGAIRIGRGSIEILDVAKMVH